MKQGDARRFVPVKVPATCDTGPGTDPDLAPAATSAIPRRPYPSASSRVKQAASRMYPLAGVSRGLRGLVAVPETVSGFAGVLVSRRAACRRLRVVRSGAQ